MTGDGDDGQSSYISQKEDRGWVPISQRKNWEDGGRVPVEESHVWPQYSSYLFGGGITWKLCRDTQGGILYGCIGNGIDCQSPAILRKPSPIFLARRRKTN